MRDTAAVITISDKGFRGERKDTSGPALVKLAEAEGLQVVYQAMIPDEPERIKQELKRCADEMGAALILTTGGTGFSPRDMTPEATLQVIERETPGIPEAMRAESMRITPRGCLSRSVAGIRGRSLIINLPGSEKAARENLLAVLPAVKHGLDMLASEGSADCGQPTMGQEAAAKQEKNVAQSLSSDGLVVRQEPPSMDAWLREAKADKSAPECGMYLFHNGVVRQSAKAKVRQGAEHTGLVKGMLFSYDGERVRAAVKEAYRMPGIRYVRVWLNEGTLQVGDDIMLVLIGGDIRPHVVDALQALVGQIKETCVEEKELF